VGALRLPFCSPGRLEDLARPAYRPRDSHEWNASLNWSAPPAGLRQAASGAALSGPSDDRDTVSLAAADGDPHHPPRMIPRASLVRIIRPWAEKILEMVRDKRHASPFAADPRRRVTLTGRQAAHRPLRSRDAHQARIRAKAHQLRIEERMPKGRSAVHWDRGPAHSLPLETIAQASTRWRHRCERLRYTAIATRQFAPDGLAIYRSELRDLRVGAKSGVILFYG
jgi:hypothetical protein